MSMEEILQRDQRQMRREVLIRRILHGLEATVQLQALKPDAPVDEVRVVFTDKSAAFIAPLAEAVEILEAILYASDGCMGHRDCAHSMEPWQRARALLQGKWESDTNPDLPRWPEPSEPSSR